MLSNAKSSPKYPRSPTAIVLVFCLLINTAFIFLDESFIASLDPIIHVRRLPYPGEFPIELEPVGYQTIQHTNYRIEADDEWKSLFPVGYSLQPIPNATILRERSLTTVPALYNELWCLNRLREIFLSQGWENDTCRDKQVHRCMNMLRQALLCNADTSLEPVVTITGAEGAKETGATGVDVVHVCRDWTKIREVMRQRINEGMV